MLYTTEGSWEKNIGVGSSSLGDVRLGQVQLRLITALVAAIVAERLDHHYLL